MFTYLTINLAYDWMPNVLVVLAFHEDTELREISNVMTSIGKSLEITLAELTT